MKLEEIKQLNEASLSRTYRLLQEHDGGLLTAFRYAEECGTGEQLTRMQNMQRNRSLGGKLRAAGYGYTTVKGAYIENYGSPNAREVGEQSFLVVDAQDKGTLKRTLMQLGEEFEQDSILFIPAGGQKGTLIGTNHCPDSYPGPGKSLTLGNPIFGRGGEFMTRVKGRPFILGECVNYVSPPNTMNAKRSMSILAKKDWRTITEEEL